jgi:hypothetical protein
MKARHAIYGIIACTAALQVNEAFAYGYNDPMMNMGLQLLQMSQPGYGNVYYPYQQPRVNNYQDYHQNQYYMRKNTEAARQRTDSTGTFNTYGD